VPAKVNTIDEYLARVPLDRRRALERLRATIRSLLPDAEECISYSMPAFRHGGYVVAGFLATSKGCSYFPFSGTTLATLAAELRAYGRTKSALHFEPERPLPKALVKKLLQARITETNASSGSRKPKRRRQAAVTSRERTRSASRSKPRARAVTPSKRTRSAAKSQARTRSRSEKS
jgi:uncharacterized protein YdhG (YjbR/CyaY superfamily)